MIKMVKKSDKKEEIVEPISEDIPFVLKRMFKANGITDEKKIIEVLRGK